MINVISMEFLRVNRRCSLARTPLAAGSDGRRLYSQATRLAAKRNADENTQEDDDEEETAIGK